MNGNIENRGSNVVEHGKFGITILAPPQTVIVITQLEGDTESGRDSLNSPKAL
jgi:hypothetical protein